MSGIEKQPLQSIRGRLIALKKAFGKQATIPAGEVILLPNVVTQLNDATPIYDQLVVDRDNLEALWKQQAGNKTNKFFITELYVIDFFKVLKITINRSVKLADGKWEASDINFYNLDETGGIIPDDMTEADVLLWAKKIKDGEANRLLAKPTAPAMVNPSAAEVTAAADVAKPLIELTSNALDLLNAKRAQLKEANVQVDLILKTVWTSVESRYAAYDADTLRDTLRGWGVVYGTVGEANTLTALVKDSAGEPLEGASVVLLETEGTTTANPEGRVSLETRTVGNITLRFSYPGKADKDVPVTIDDEAEGTTIDLGIVVLEA
jgi:hypothetical protein